MTNPIMNIRKEKNPIVKVNISLEPYFEVNGENPVEAEITLNIKSEQELLDILSEFYRLYISKLTNNKLESK